MWKKTLAMSETSKAHEKIRGLLVKESLDWRGAVVLFFGHFEVKIIIFCQHFKKMC